MDEAPGELATALAQNGNGLRADQAGAADDDADDLVPRDPSFVGSNELL
jgi:hypothetical protein